jgi:hypothetical protein
MTQNLYTRSLPTSDFVASVRALLVERQGSRTFRRKENSSRYHGKCTSLHTSSRKSNCLAQDFIKLSRPALRPTQPPVQWLPDLSTRGKEAGRGVYQTPPSMGLHGLRELLIFIFYFFKLLNIFEINSETVATVRKKQTERNLAITEAWMQPLWG